MESPAIQTCRDPVEAERPARPGFLFRMLSGGRREVLFWSLQTLFWATIGLIGFLMTLAFRVSLPDVGWVLCMRVVTGFVLTVGLRGIYRLAWFRQRGRLTKWPLAAGCCLALALLEVLVLHGMSAAGVSLPGGVETIGVRLLFVRFFVMSFWSVLYFVFHLFEDEHAMEMRATRAELAARENELRHLQAQMNPHFLFNALNGVLACKDDPEAVRDVTRSLAEYLRFMLQETRPLEPLARELNALEKFLSVQASHFGRNMVCRIHWDPAVRSVMVPPMMVQPLLENAFQYRPQNQDLPLQIWLTARLEEGFLRVSLSNTGEWVPPADHEPQGKGIQALRQRLHLLLGPQARVEQVVENGWIRSTIHIPLPEKSLNPRSVSLAAAGP